ncbi:hypothetical protein [Orgyia pseudotsugata single capsid nuclopolyhedrovirus]|nr:hypothetical protein [Orgyia pseudotsugata single capsid nuclopolyhedrovirus]
MQQLGRRRFLVVNVIVIAFVNAHVVFVEIVSCARRRVVVHELGDFLQRHTVVVQIAAEIMTYHVGTRSVHFDTRLLEQTFKILERRRCVFGDLQNRWMFGVNLSRQLQRFTFYCV